MYVYATLLGLLLGAVITGGVAAPYSLAQSMGIGSYEGLQAVVTASSGYVRDFVQRHVV